MDGKKFQQKLFDIVTNGYVCLSLSMGQELGLFNHVTALPQSVAEIAISSGYKQRYVEEWLKSMAISGFIEVTEDGTKFWIPDSHRQYLTKANPVMALSTGVPMIAAAYYQVKECFKKDGPLGVPYSCYPNISQFMSSITDSYLCGENFISMYLSMVPNVVEKFKSDGVRYLDIGCGRGSPSYILAKAFPKCQSFGIDILDSSIEYANARAEKENIKNVHYFTHDSANLPLEWSNTFDYVTAFDTLHEQYYPEKVFGEIFKVLKPGCYFSLLEVNACSNVYVNKTQMKFGSIFQPASLFLCLPVASQVKDGAGLGIMAGIEVFLTMAKKVGFIEINVAKMPDLDFLNTHCIFQKPHYCDACGSSH